MFQEKRDVHPEAELQKNSLSVYVEQGKNILVFNNLFLL